MKKNKMLTWLANSVMVGLFLAGTYFLLKSQCRADEWPMTEFNIAHMSVGSKTLDRHKKKDQTVLKGKNGCEN